MSMYSESLRAFLKPIARFLDDPQITEVMVNGPNEVWVERGGKIVRTDATFTEDGLAAAARNIAQFVGRVLSDERPRLDARLPDGSRIHVILPPVARRGITMDVRKFAKDTLTMDRLVELGSASPALARLCEALIRLRLNIIVSGGTGSGKTTLLGLLTAFIPEEERILTIEDSAELQIPLPHVVGFESRPPDKFGKGEVTLGDLLNSALRLRPDRIIVGEVHGGECFFLLQAMNTGHAGSMATTHANTPTDTLRRLEALTLLSGLELPVVAIRAQVASAIHVVVTCERFPDGSRKLIDVAEVLPLSDRGEYRTQDLFVYTQTGRDAATGKVQGYHSPTGVLPTFLGRLRANGFSDIDERFFDPATYRVQPPPLFHHEGELKTRWAPSLKHREQGLPDPEHLALSAPDQPLIPSAVEGPSAPPPATVAPLAAAASEPSAERGREPEPQPLSSSALTTETPPPVSPPPPPAAEGEDETTAADRVPSEGAGAGREVSGAAAPAADTDPNAKPVPPPPGAAAHPGVPAPAADTRPDAKPVPSPSGAAAHPGAPPAPPTMDEPSIQISPDLLADMQRVVSNEATYVRQNPLMLHERVAPKPGPKAAHPTPAPARRARDEEEKTDPNIRVPK